MTKQKQTKVYVSLVTLKLLEVPFDMMRYDNLVPASEEDSYKLGRVADGSASPEDRIVKFRRFAMVPGEPTTDRYRGFGAMVLSWETKE